LNFKCSSTRNEKELGIMEMSCEMHTYTMFCKTKKIKRLKFK